MDAIKNGATKIICEEGSYEVETIIVKDTRVFLAEELKRKYKKELDDLKLIGITGTNGKTTSCYLVYQLLNKLGIKTSYIGTLGFYLDNQAIPLNNTTPDIMDLYEMFLKSQKAGCKVVVMEVSSQALSYDRLLNIEFDIACFTNLTQDHLDYHKTMENYKKSKQILFHNLKNEKLAIINKDDNYYKDFLFEDNNNILYGTNNSDYKIINYNLDIDKTSFILLNNNKEYEITIPLACKYNIYNYLNALIISHKLGNKIEKIIEESKNLIQPNGRFEIISKNNKVVIIDYAHTPDAVNNILNNINEYKKGKIYTIIGCGGNRDRKKRPIMGEIATSKSDYVIFTNDNPRFEDEKVIINDIIYNLNNTNFEIIYDRKEAIKKGISLLKNNDILLILGKGHENYQIINNKKYYFNDKEIALKYL